MKGGRSQCLVRSRNSRHSAERIVHSHHIAISRVSRRTRVLARLAIQTARHRRDDGYDFATPFLPHVSIGLSRAKKGGGLKERNDGSGGSCEESIAARQGRSRWTLDRLGNNSYVPCEIFEGKLRAGLPPSSSAGLALVTSE